MSGGSGGGGKSISKVLAAPTFSGGWTFLSFTPESTGVAPTFALVVLLVLAGVTAAFSFPFTAVGVVERVALGDEVEHPAPDRDTDGQRMIKGRSERKKIAM